MVSLQLHLANQCNVRRDANTMKKATQSNEILLKKSFFYHNLPAETILSKLPLIVALARASYKVLEYDEELAYKRMYICDRTGSCQAEHEVKICCCLSSFCSAKDLVVVWYDHTIKYKAFCIALPILSSLAWHWGETPTILSTFALEQYRAGSYSRKLNPREAPFYQTLSAFSSVFIILFISPVLPGVGWEFP